MNKFPAHIVILSIVVTLGSACASKGVPVFVAPSMETIQSGTEMAFSGDGQYVYIINHSSVPIVITGLNLVDCQNIKNRCEVMHLRVRVLPGQRVNLATVRSQNTSLPSSFRFTYTWEAAPDR